MPPFRVRLITAFAVLAIGVAGCGSSASKTGSASTQQTQSSNPTAPAPVDLTAAQHPRAELFPPASGKSLQQLANVARSGLQLGNATGVFTPGTRRVAFGVTDSAGSFVYAPSALYIAATPGSPARGPFLAPADPVTVEQQYRSQQNSGPGGLQAIYAANVVVPRPGTYSILAVMKMPSGFAAAGGQIAVGASSPIPDVGQRPPAIATETPASVGSHADLLTTRIPRENMQQVSFKDVLGKRPIALLISTPQLCQSRVCGPVTDVAVQLQHEYGDRVAFIHEEVYVNNQPAQGLRPQLKALHLQTEPWLFTVNRQGRIAARLEGTFGLDGFRKALDAALR
jgi:hypothetical protein